MDRRYVLFIAQIITPILLVLALLFYASPMWVLVSVAMFFLYRGIGVTITYHRIHAHGTHKMHPIIEAICTTLGFYGSLSSPIAFCATHNSHHKHEGTWKDPHPPNLIGWRAMFPLFWNGKAPTFGYDLKTVVRLKKNKIVMFFEKHYWKLLLVPFLLLLISIEAFLFIFLVPVSISLLGLAVSVFNHDSTGKAKTQGLLFGLITAGEHAHEWHHKYPWDTSGEGFLNTVINLIAEPNKVEIK